MAKQDLYKTAQQSAKLFKLISEHEELEGWVSKKITKAAEDIESVYQYLNFEKHFKEQERSINANTSLSESAKDELRAKLAEAKDKVAKMKIKAAKNKSEKMDEDKEMKVGDTKKTRTGELTKTSTGVIHKNTSYHDDGDEIASNAKSGKGIKSHAKAQSAAEKKEKAPAQKMSPKSAKTWGMSNSEKFDNRDKVDEAKAKCCCEEKSKAKCPVHGKIDETKKELKGGQKKLDKNHNGKLDKNDFEKLRAERKVDETVSPEKTKIRESIARAKALLEAGKGKKKGDGNLANNAKPYDKVTRGDVIAGRLGKDEKGGKKEVVKESTEFARMKTLMTRLNG
jgi:hypothetical protein